MKKVIPITPSTGGAVKPQNIIGRDAEIGIFWEILTKQGIALFAERRFGKSSILRKMEANPRAGFITVYRPIEGISSPVNWASALLDRTKELKLIDQGTKDKLEDFYNKVTDVVEEVKGIKLKRLEYTWQKQIYHLLERLIERHPDKVIVIMLDEFSIFLDKLTNEEASTVIGFLRNITFEDKFSNIRFVYCGSIGIDLVLDKIKDQGHNIGDPLNHMEKFELQTFTNENAKYFGDCLNLGLKLKLSDESINLICRWSDNIPYFIDIVFDKISKTKNRDKKVIENIFDEILDDTKGKESIKHFYDRIERFYPKPKISILILNFISRSKSPISETDIASIILSGEKDIDRIEINKEIERLKNDGYLIRSRENDERIYDFKYSLLKSWWQRNKAF